jgi:ELWxxDGT repeat protein
MRAWRAVAWSCALIMACGGPLPEEELPSDELATEEVSQPETEEGEVSASWKNEHPTLGRARFVKDIFPDANFRGEEPQNLVSFRGKLYFAARQEDGRRQLWRSNGTEAGTVVVVEFPPLLRPGGSFYFLSNLTPVGRQLFFTVADETHGSELWVTDGTREGARLVKDLTPGPEGPAPHTLVAVGKTLFFFRTIGAAPSLPGRTELWTSDGTGKGTVRVRDFGPGTTARIDRVIARGDTLFFFLADSEGGYELWKSDGSRAGTVRLRSFDPEPLGNAPNSLRVVGRLVYFIADESAHGNELWRTDGTVAGTELVEDLTPGPASTILQLLDVARDHLFFTTRDLTGAEVRLYKLKVGGFSHGAPKLVTTLPNPFAGMPEIGASIRAFATTGEKLFFSLAFFDPGPAPVEHQLWVTDGTRSGTKLLHRPLSRSDEFTTELFPVDDLLLFPANDADEETGTELWMSDGTVKGTRLLRDINPGFFSSNPHAFTRVGDCVFFIAFRDDVGEALWVVHARRSSHASVVGAER